MKADVCSGLGRRARKQGGPTSVCAKIYEPCGLGYGAATNSSTDEAEVTVNVGQGLRVLQYQPRQFAVILDPPNTPIDLRSISLHHCSVCSVRNPREDIPPSPPASAATPRRPSAWPSSWLLPHHTQSQRGTGWARCRLRSMLYICCKRSTCPPTCPTM